MIPFKTYLYSDVRQIPNWLSVSAPSQGRRLVIPDIHACPKTLRSLLNLLQITKYDQLFFLGDFINKGKDSIGVLNCLIDLIENDYQVFPLMGNHEQMLIEEHNKTRKPKDFLFPNSFRNMQVLNAKYKIIDKYLGFLLNLPYYYELDQYFLVHAGFNFYSANPFEDFDNMLWMRECKTNEGLQKGKKIIYGHTPTVLPSIEAAIKNREAIIPLDNGCVYVNRWFMGNLLCLNLDTFEIFKQPCID